MVLDYSVNLPKEEEVEETPQKDSLSFLDEDKLDEERKKRLMTRSSMQATYLGAAQAPVAGAAPVGLPKQTGWGSTNQ